MSSKLLKRGALLTAGQAAGLIISFVRNMAIAKFIGRENLGISAGFATTMMAVELASDLGMQKQVVQSPRADAPEFLNTAHSVALLRGIVMSAILLAIAVPSANWFKAPQAVWAFQLLAVVPLLKSLVNLDTIRVQRDLRFKPFLVCELSSQLCATFVGVIAAYSSPSYAAVLYAILAQFFVSSAVSHLVASAPYRFGWDKETVKEITSFGWPLMFSGVLMFAGIQADRLIIAGAFTLGLLGTYEFATKLTFPPMSGLARVLNSMALPLLSNQERSAFLRRFQQISRFTTVLISLFGIACIFFVPRFIDALFQDEYPESVQLVGLVGILMCVRLMRIVPAQAQLALAETKGLLVANVCRALTVPIMAVLAFSGAGIEAVVSLLILGELLALGSAFVWLRRFQNIPLFSAAAPILLSILFLSTVFAIDRVVFDCKFSVTWLICGTAFTLLLAGDCVRTLWQFRNRSRKSTDLPLPQPGVN